MKIILVALLFLSGLVFAQDNKLLFKGVSLNDNPQTVLSNLQKVGFKIKSSESSPGSESVEAYTQFVLVGPYFKWKDCKIELFIIGGEVERVVIPDSDDELFKALVIKYGMPQRYDYGFKWTGFVDGQILKGSGGDILFFTIHKFRQAQQKEQQKIEQYRKWGENL